MHFLQANANVGILSEVNLLGKILNCKETRNRLKFIETFLRF